MKIPVWLKVGIIVSLLVLVPSYIVVNEYYGVPLWWAFPITLGSGVQLSNFAIPVSPDSPTSFGQEITVTVSDSQTHQPISNATVSVIKDGSTVLQPSPA